MRDAIERLRTVRGYECSRSNFTHLSGDVGMDPLVMVAAGEVGPDPGLLGRMRACMRAVSPRRS